MDSLGLSIALLVHTHSTTSRIFRSSILGLYCSNQTVQKLHICVPVASITLKTLICSAFHPTALFIQQLPFDTNLCCYFSVAGGEFSNIYPSFVYSLQQRNDLRPCARILRRCPSLVFLRHPQDDPVSCILIRASPIDILDFLSTSSLLTCPAYLQSSTVASSFSIECRYFSNYTGL